MGETSRSRASMPRELDAPGDMVDMLHCVMESEACHLVSAKVAARKDGWKAEAVDAIKAAAARPKKNFIVDEVRFAFGRYLGSNFCAKSLAPGDVRQRCLSHLALHGINKCNEKNGCPQTNVGRISFPHTLSDRARGGRQPPAERYDQMMIRHAMRSPSTTRTIITQRAIRG